jgi:hypothetical protein
MRLIEVLGIVISENGGTEIAAGILQLEQRKHL